MTEEYQAVTSDPGRHRFTIWWRVQQDVNEELVKYTCRDSVWKGSMDEPIHTYLHTYYEDIETSTARTSTDSESDPTLLLVRRMVRCYSPLALH